MERDQAFRDRFLISLGSARVPRAGDRAVAIRQLLRVRIEGARRSERLEHRSVAPPRSSGRSLLFAAQTCLAPAGCSLFGFARPAL
jgi:hypothetical protein